MESNIEEDPRYTVCFENKHTINGVEDLMQMCIDNKVFVSNEESVSFSFFRNWGGKLDYGEICLNRNQVREVIVHLSKYLMGEQ